MAQGIDILHLFPDLAAIGQQQLQAYCDDWLRRPMAREFAVAQLTVDERLMLQINLTTQGPAFCGDRVFIPVDELLGYIVDCHFDDADKRRELHASIRETRRRWGALGRDYEVTIGRVGTLYLTCKNPECRTELETHHQATQNQEIICPPTDVTCPVCGSTYKYGGNDLHLRPAI